MFAIVTPVKRPATNSRNRLDWQCCFSSNGKTDAIRTEENPSDLEKFLIPDNRSPGAVGIRFDCAGTSFAFVCAHFSGGDGMNACAKRNVQYRKLASELFVNQVNYHHHHNNNKQQQQQQQTVVANSDATGIKRLTI